MIYYHGGIPGLRAGQMILPPAETGAKCASDFGAEHVHNRARIYVTTSEVAAIMFGSMYPKGRGWVYEVEPIGEIKHDPDCDAPGLSYECERAKVIRGREIRTGERKRIFAAMRFPLF